MEREEEDKKRFKVIDKRHVRNGSDAASEKAQEIPRADTGASQPSRKEAPKEREMPPLEVTFASFIYSLTTSALVALGELPEPGTEKTEVNLPLAKQTIDILGILQEKTSGNLTDEEHNLLTNLLYDLRMRYVRVSK